MIQKSCNNCKHCNEQGHFNILDSHCAICLTKGDFLGFESKLYRRKRNNKLNIIILLCAVLLCLFTELILLCIANVTQFFIISFITLSLLVMLIFLIIINRRDNV